MTWATFVDDAVGTFTGSAGNEFGTLTGAFPSLLAGQQYAVSIAPGTSKSEIAIATANTSGTLTFATPLGFTHTSDPIALVVTSAFLNQIAAGNTVINAAAYGMSGSETDNSGPLQEAANAASMSEVTGWVYVPPNITYPFQNGVTWPSNVGLLGGAPVGQYGGGAVFQGSAGFSGSILTTGSDSQFAGGIVMKDISFDSLASTPSCTGLTCITTAASTFKRLRFSNAMAGMIVNRVGSGTGSLDAAHNFFSDIYGYMPAAGAYTAISIGNTFGTGHTSNDVHHDNWQRVFINCSLNNTVGAKALYFAGCDAISMNDVHLLKAGGVNFTKLTFDYGAGYRTNQPSGCNFRGFDLDETDGSIPWQNLGPAPGTGLSTIPTVNYIREAVVQNSAVNAGGSPALTWNPLPNLVCVGSEPTPITTPALTASVSTVLNPYPWPVLATIQAGSGAITNIKVQASATPTYTSLLNWTSAGIPAGNFFTFRIPANSNTQVTYSGSTPGWYWQMIPTI